MEVISIDEARRTPVGWTGICTTKVLFFRDRPKPIASLSKITRPTDKSLLFRLAGRLADYENRARASKRVYAKAVILLKVLLEGTCEIGKVPLEEGIPFKYYEKAFISVKALCEARPLTTQAD